MREIDQVSITRNAGHDCSLFCLRKYNRRSLFVLFTAFLLFVFAVIVLNILFWSLFVVEILRRIYIYIVNGAYVIRYFIEIK